MTRDVVTATYSSQDAEFALEHGSFRNFKRNLALKELTILPREAQPGPGGGEYRYGHIVEFALQMHIGAAFSREIARNVIRAGFLKMRDQYGLDKLNALDRETQIAFSSGRQFTKDEDPFDLAPWAVDHPLMIFGPDVISRNENQPLFWLFNATRVNRITPHDIRLLNGDISLVEMHEALVSVTTYPESPEETQQNLLSSCHVPGLVNLTSILTRLDYRLGVRLHARKPIG